MSRNTKALKAALVETIVLDLICPVIPIRDLKGEISGYRRFKENARPGFTGGHDFMSAFERSYGALLPLDVFTPLDRNGLPLPQGTFSASYRLNVDISDIHDHCLHSNLIDNAEEADLFDAFVVLSVAQRCSLPDTKHWFSVDPDFQRVMKMLAEQDYLGRLGDRFRWKEKAEKAMRDHYLWDANGNSFGDMETGRLEKIWHSMPQSVRKRYFLDIFDPLGFAICYSHCWDGEQEVWNSEDVPQKQGETVLSGGGVGIAKELEARYLKPYRAE